MYLRELDQIATETTLPTPRKLFERHQKKDFSSSRSTSRRSLRDKSEKPQFSTPYIKITAGEIGKYTNLLKLNIFPQTQQYGVDSATSVRHSCVKGMKTDRGLDQKQMANKIEQLLEETLQRQEELNEMTVEKQGLLIEIEELRTKVKILEENNSELSESQHSLKQELKSIIKEKNTIQKEKQMFAKKILDLQTIKCTNLKQSSKSFQTAREEYLEKQLSELRQTLNQENVFKLKQLEEELSQLERELFKANKTIDNLRMTNICLKQKNDRFHSELKSTPELLGLLSKYKKTLEERNQLKKSKQISLKEVENLLKQNSKLVKQLQRLQQLSFNEESLNFSIVSQLE